MQLRLQLFTGNRSIYTRAWPLVFQFRQDVEFSSYRGFSSDLKQGLGPTRRVFRKGNILEKANTASSETKPYPGANSPIKIRRLDQDKTSQNGAPRNISDPRNPRDVNSSSHPLDDNINKVLDANDDAPTSLQNLVALNQLQNISDGRSAEGLSHEGFHDPLIDGHKFGLPELPIPKDANFKYRSDPIVLQVTNLLMRDGKKSVAQRNMSFILNSLRMSPPPTLNPARLLLPGHPPPHHLPLDPVAYLTLAIDSVAPLLRIRSERGAAGGGAALQIPVPLAQRQRRRQAVMWILDSVNKRPNRGSGRGMFAKRFADEIINVIEGKSSAWDKRTLVHKTGTTARNNIAFRRRR